MKKIYGIRHNSNFKNKRHLFIKRGISSLPHIFTLGNVFFGFGSLLAAAKGNFVEAAYCIFIAALMDMFDGKIARLSGTSSEIGFHLDSLADAISFCIAPAFLAYIWYIERMGFMGFITIFLYITCGLLRLARFNSKPGESSTYLIGLPSTVAGCFLSSLALNFHFLPQKPESFLALMFSIVAISFLMVSTIIFYKISFSIRADKKHVWFLIFSLGLGVLISLGLSVLLFLIFLVYITISCYRDLTRKQTLFE